MTVHGIASKEIRYNPRLKKPFGSAYRPWFFLLGCVVVIIGVISIGCSVATHELYKDVHNELFQLWVGVPLVVIGLVAIVAFMTRNKKLVVFLLIVCLIMMAVCATAALLGGLRFWSERWSQTRYKLNKSGECAVTNGECICRGIVVPAKISSCSDLEQMTELMITQLAMAAFGFLFSVALAYLSMMAICCGPWQYLDESMYDKRFDPDLTNPQSVQVRSVHARSSSLSRGTTNPVYSM